jgi:hypothetical protein
MEIEAVSELHGNDVSKQSVARPREGQKKMILGPVWHDGGSGLQLALTEAMSLKAA